MLKFINGSHSYGFFLFAVSTVLLVLPACNLSRSIFSEDAWLDSTEIPSTEVLKEEWQVQTTSAVESGAPDIIFYNAMVLTMEDGQPEASAAAVSDGRIIAVGEGDAILVMKSAHTQVIDLEGRVLMPGFVDSHTHILHDSVMAGSSLEEAQNLALRYGITSIGEMFVPPEFLEEVQRFHRSGDLHLRTNLYPIYNTNCGDKLGEWYLDSVYSLPVSDEMLRVDGVKVFSDGGSCRGVALSFELEEGAGYGDLFVDRDELLDVIRNAQESGLQVAVHVLGDRALDVVLDAFSAAMEGEPNALRHRIEHNAVIRPEQLHRYGELDIVATIRGLYPACEPFGPPLPEPYRSWEWRVNSLRAANPTLHIAWHSDYPYHSIIPLNHLFGFVTRYDVGKLGQTCPPPEYLADDTISVDDALKIMTLEGAYALRRDEVGSLRVGKWADMIILSDDPRAVEPQDIKSIDVLMTMVGGEVEWCAKGFEDLCPAESLPSSG